jgi:hypothetical protein
MLIDTQVLNAFVHYAITSLPRIGKCEDDFHALSPELRRLVPGFDAKMQAVKQAIVANQEFLSAIAAEAGHMFVNQDLTTSQPAATPRCPDCFCDSCDCILIPSFAHPM